MLTKIIVVSLIRCVMKPRTRKCWFTNGRPDIVIVDSNMGSIVHYWYAPEFPTKKFPRCDVCMKVCDGMLIRLPITSMDHSGTTRSWSLNRERCESFTRPVTPQDHARLCARPIAQ